MSFIQENIITLDFNLKNTYTLVHFSDVHVININDNETNEEKEKAIKQEQAWYRVRKDFANHFHEKCEDIHMIPSTTCLDNLLKYSKDVNPDCLIMTGDIIDYYSKANLSYLTNALKDETTPYLLCCGNHEKAHIFNELTNNQSDYKVIRLDELKIIALDDSCKSFSEKQYNLLIEELKENIQTIICFHIPLLTKTNKEEMSKYDSYFIIDHENCDLISKKTIDLFIENENVKAILCGHTHGASTSFYCKDKPIICASSGLIGYVNKIIIK